MAGQLIDCPHCEKRIKLQRTVQIPCDWLMWGGYISAVVTPLIGFLIGGYFVSKKQFNPGIPIIVLGLFGCGMWFNFYVGFFPAMVKAAAAAANGN